MNIQHIESLNEDVKNITGIEVSERVPDKVLALADEVVNIDLTADELLTRLKEGKIYKKKKLKQLWLISFRAIIFYNYGTTLKEVATHVERKVEAEIKPRTSNLSNFWPVSAVTKKWPKQLSGKQPASLVITAVHGLFSIFRNLRKDRKNCP